MKDKYSDFQELAKDKARGRDFRVRVRKRENAMLVLAPHGGGIEPGTSEIAEAIAGSGYSFYAFEGIKVTGNQDLHITSSRFDEPRCVALAERSDRAIAIHGEGSPDEVVFIGGRDRETLGKIRRSLEVAGSCVKTHTNPKLQGEHRMNICNRTSSGAGVQLELSKGLRRSFFRDLTTSGRRRRTTRFRDFVKAVQGVLP